MLSYPRNYKISGVKMQNNKVYCLCKECFDPLAVDVFLFILIPDICLPILQR